MVREVEIFFWQRQENVSLNAARHYCYKGSHGLQPLELEP